MAEPTEGTYLVINANSLKALDVRGSSDKAGTKVYAYDVNRNDAQIWSLTERDGGWQLLCSLTGKCLGTFNGSLIVGVLLEQWSRAAGKAQVWDLEMTGSTIIYNGAEEPTYNIVASGSALVAAAASVDSGANVVLSNSPSSTLAQWILVPVPALSEGGTYELAPAVDTSLRVAVGSSSKADGARLVTWAANGRDSQRFDAVVDAGTMLCTLLNVNSGKAVAVAGSGTQAGVGVIQWNANGSANQSWLLVQDGAVTLNGNDVPTYQMRLQNKNGLCLDVCGGGTTLRTNVEVHARNGSAAQRFVLVKTEVLGTTLPAPTQLLQTLAHGTGTVEVVPSFLCDATAYQARMRRVAHDSGDATTVGEWENVADGSTARDGWGEAWEPTFEVAQGGTVTMPLTISEALDASVPRVDWEVEVRAFSPSWGPTGSKAHGPSTVSTVTLALDPTVTVGDVELDLSGEPALSVPVSSDVPRDGNRVTVMLMDAGGSPLMAGPVSATMPRSGSVEVPASLLWDLPADGDTVMVAWTWETPDGGMSSGTATVSADMGSGVVPATVADGANLTDVVTADPDARVFLLVERGDGAELAEMPGSGGTFWACPPLNVPYVLYVATTAGVTALQRPPKAACGNWWVWGDAWSHSAHFEVQRGSRPSQTMSHSPDVAVLDTSGRPRPIASANQSGRLDLSVTGYLRDGGQADFEALAAALGRGMAPVYRTARGDWYRVAVTGVDLSWDRPTGNSLRVTQQAVAP